MSPAHQRLDHFSHQCRSVATCLRHKVQIILLKLQRHMLKTNRGQMKGLVYDCCDRLVVGLDNLLTVDEIMEFSACKCVRKQFLLHFSHIEFPPLLRLVRHKPERPS